MTAREAIAEDIDFDPSHRRQLEVARWILGQALNYYPRERPAQPLFRRVQEPTRQELIDYAISQGLVWYDEWHHAPLCPANNWSKQRLPDGPCTCGAQRHQIR